MDKETTYIAGIEFDPNKQLTEEQIAAINIKMQMGNQVSPQVLKAYNSSLNIKDIAINELKNKTNDTSVISKDAEKVSSNSYIKSGAINTSKEFADSGEKIINYSTVEDEKKKKEESLDSLNLLNSSNQKINYSSLDNSLVDQKIKDISSISNTILNTNYDKPSIENIGVNTDFTNQPSTKQIKTNNLATQLNLQKTNNDYSFNSSSSSAINQPEVSNIQLESQKTNNDYSFNSSSSSAINQPEVSGIDLGNELRALTTQDIEMTPEGKAGHKQSDRFNRPFASAETLQREIKNDPLFAKSSKDYDPMTKALMQMSVDKQKTFSLAQPNYNNSINNASANKSQVSNIVGLSSIDRQNSITKISDVSFLNNSQNNINNTLQTKIDDATNENISSKNPFEKYKGIGYQSNIKIETFKQNNEKNEFKNKNIKNNYSSISESNFINNKMNSNDAKLASLTIPGQSINLNLNKVLEKMPSNVLNTISDISQNVLNSDMDITNFNQESSAFNNNLNIETIMNNMNNMSSVFTNSFSGLNQQQSKNDSNEIDNITKLQNLSNNIIENVFAQASPNSSFISSNNVNEFINSPFGEQFISSIQTLQSSITRRGFDIQSMSTSSMNYRNKPRIINQSSRNNNAAQPSPKMYKPTDLWDKNTVPDPNPNLGSLAAQLFI